MNIVVCIKQVPDTTEIKIDPITNTLKREGVPSIINPDDKAGLETALRLKEQYNASVTVICMGPPQAQKALCEVLAMGADRAILLTDRAFAGSDTLATSKILAAAIKKLPYDLIVTGRQAIDGDTAQVGPQIAEHLNIPQVTYSAEISYDANSDTFTVKRQMEDRYQILKAKAPLLITALSSIAKPRYMSVSGITSLDEKQPEIWSYQDVDIPKEEIGLNGSPTKVWQTFNKTVGGEKHLYELEPDEAAKMIATALKEKNLI